MMYVFSVPLLRTCGMPRGVSVVPEKLLLGLYDSKKCSVANLTASDADGCMERRM